MKEIKDVKENIKYGNVLTVSSNINQTEYYACMTKYDGRVFQDVIEVQIGSFLDQIPNIKEKIGYGQYLKVEYDLETREYQSAIMYKIREGGYQEPFKEQVWENFCNKNIVLEDSLIDLDTEIANRKSQESQKKKQKVS